MVGTGMAAGEYTLRGAIVRSAGIGAGRLRIVLRDTDYQSIDAVEADAPAPAVWLKRGMQIEVPGELGEFEEEPGNPLSMKRVWKGKEAPRVCGKAPGVLKREQCAARVRAEVMHKRVQLKRCGTLYVVTRLKSKGHADVDATLATLGKRPGIRMCLPDHCEVEIAICSSRKPSPLQWECFCRRSLTATSSLPSVEGVSGSIISRTQR
jgi:hypothetical protein